eukprot:gene10490-11620_t
MIRDLLGEERTEYLLAEIQPFVENLQELGWNEIKPWGEFFATFKAPQWNVRHLEQRVTTNFLYYRSNYFTVCCAVLILQILFSPMIIFSALLIYGLMTYLLHIHHQPLIIGDITFDKVGKQWLGLGLSFLILLVTGTLVKLLWSALYAVLLCGLHLLFRPRNVSSKVNRMYEEAKLNGYGGLFNLHLPGESKFDSKVDDDMLEAPYVTEEDYDSKFGGDLHHRKRGSGGSGKYSEY